MKNKKVLSAMLILALACVSEVAEAQRGRRPVFRPPVVRPRGRRPPVTSAPLDGGLSLLIGAGIAYAAKKAYDARRKGEELH